MHVTVYMFRLAYTDCSMKPSSWKFLLMMRTSAAMSKFLKKMQIHGAFHLHRPNVSRTEKWVENRKWSLIERIFFRIFWSSSLSISVAILFVLILNTADKFFSYDTLVELNYYKDSVADVPFPAVTFCPDSLVFEKILDFQEKSLNGNFTDDEWVNETFLGYVAMDCFLVLLHTSCWTFFTIKILCRLTFQLSH